jgi:hypothetical protein
MQELAPVALGCRQSACPSEQVILGCMRTEGGGLYNDAKIEPLWLVA